MWNSWSNIASTYLVKCTLVYLILCEFGNKLIKCEMPKDFIITDILTDGERETRIQYHGLTAKETTSGVDSTLKFRQLSDGRHFIQLIYESPNNNSLLRDCEIIKKRPFVLDFVGKFREEVRDLVDRRNITVTTLTPELLMAQNLTAANTWWLNYPKLRRKCRRVHEALKRELMESVERKRKSETTRLSRSIMSPLKQMFIAPGTKWCGASNKAKRYVDLGMMAGPDRCCRRHDHCRVNIAGMENRWGLWNTQPFTISHCGCDNSFRACLKVADNGVANMVGKLFFNVFQTKCFVLKSQKVCKKYSWWGNKCLKWGHKKVAHLRDNVPY